MSDKNLLEFIKKWKYCPMCGEKLRREIETDINSPLLCKNVLCEYLKITIGQ